MRVLLSALLAAAIATSPALARDTDIATRHVRVADLDLSTPAHQATLRYRIGRALEAVCGAYTDPAPYAQDQVTACRKRASASIEQQPAVMLAAR